jgi:aspartate-semialdehyde dehydrogenase
MSVKIAVVGATGIVGSIFLEILSQCEINIAHVDAIASTSSVGASVSFGDKEILVHAIETYDFKNVDVVIFATSTDISRIYIPRALKAGCFVIDKSSLHRLENNVPLVIPEINGDDVDWNHAKLISNPNCMVTAITMALKPLDNLSPIRRVVATTFQSVSGAGKRAMDELFQQTRGVFMGSDIENDSFPKQIAFNVIPQIGDIDEKSGETEEEVNISMEAQKILGHEFAITATCVRTPVFIGHCASLNIELEDDFTVTQIRNALKKFPGVLVVDKYDDGGYITPQEAAGENEVFISRIRKDMSYPNTINLWVLTDNLRKGAALNAYQILERIYQEHFES